MFGPVGGSGDPLLTLSLAGGHLSDRVDSIFTPLIELSTSLACKPVNRYHYLQKV